jgi:hypothetical protein
VSNYAIGAEVLAVHPDWRYLVTGGTVRPPTDDEAKAYEARAGDGGWRWLYDPVPGAPPAAAVLPAEVPPLAELPLAELPAPPDPDQAADDAQHAADVRLAAWTSGASVDGPGSVRVLPAAAAASAPADQETTPGGAGQPADEEGSSAY